MVRQREHGFQAPVGVSEPPPHSQCRGCLGCTLSGGQIPARDAPSLTRRGWGLRALETAKGASCHHEPKGGGALGPGSSRPRPPTPGLHCPLSPGGELSSPVE